MFSDVADVVVFLVSDKSSYVTGASIAVTGMVFKDTRTKVQNRLEFFASQNALKKGAQFGNRDKPRYKYLNKLNGLNLKKTLMISYSLLKISRSKIIFCPRLQQQLQGL